jgi:hypothetical protein
MTNLFDHYFAEVPEKIGKTYLMCLSLKKQHLNTVL